MRLAGDRTALGGAAAALASVVVIGATFPVIAELSDFPFATGQGGRYLLAAVVLLLLLRGVPRLPARRQLGRLLALSTSGLIAYNAFLLLAVSSTDPATVGVIIGLLPVLLALVVPLAARRRPQTLIVVCAIVSSLGAMLVQHAGGDVTAMGVVYALAALVCEIAFILLVSELMRTLTALEVAFWASVLAVPQLLVWILLFEVGDLSVAPSTSELLAILFLGLAGSVVAMVLWSIGVARLGSERFGVFTAATPVAALLTSALIGDAVVTWVRVAGCVIVALTIVVVARQSRAAGDGTSHTTSPGEILIRQDGPCGSRVGEAGRWS